MRPAPARLNRAGIVPALEQSAAPQSEPAGGDYIALGEPRCPGISIRLRRIALTTATVRLVVLSFRIAFLMWKLTVLSLIFRIIPISQDDFPSAVQRRHSRSRSDNSIFSFLCSAGCAISAKAI